MNEAVMRPRFRVVLFLLLLVTLAGVAVLKNNTRVDSPKVAGATLPREAATAAFAARGATIEANKAAARARGSEDAAGTTDFPALLTTPIDIVGDGPYVLSAGPVDSSIVMPSSFAFDFPNDLDFRFARSSWPKLVRKDGGLYLEFSFQAVGVKRPYEGFRVWVS